MQFQAFYNSPPATKFIYLENIKISDADFSSQLDIFSTDGLRSDYDVQFMFTNLTIDSIGFENVGNILSLNQKLSSTLVIQNSTFTNLDHAVITIGSTSNSADDSFQPKVNFINCIFNSTTSSSSSFISVLGRAEVSISNCSFSYMSTLGDGAVLTVGERLAIVRISISVFSFNSAVQGGVFNLQSESKIVCTNCSLTDNFAVSGGVVKATVNGQFEFFNSTFSRNMANEYLLFFMFDNVQLSIVDSSTIFDNIALSTTTIVQELTDN